VRDASVNEAGRVGTALRLENELVGRLARKLVRAQDITEVIYLLPDLNGRGVCVYQCQFGTAQEETPLPEVVDVQSQRDRVTRIGIDVVGDDSFVIVEFGSSR
jgi:hypothetical protein